MLLCLGTTKFTKWSGIPFPIFDVAPMTAAIRKIEWKWKLLSSVWLSVTPMDSHQAPLHRIFLGKDTGVVCHFLLQGIFLTQGSNWGLLRTRHFFYWLRYQGSPNRKISQKERLCTAFSNMGSVNSGMSGFINPFLGGIWIISSKNSLQCLTVWGMEKGNLLL